MLPGAATPEITSSSSPSPYRAARSSICHCCSLPTVAVVVGMVVVLVHTTHGREASSMKTSSMMRRGEREQDKGNGRFHQAHTNNNTPLCPTPAHSLSASRREHGGVRNMSHP